MASKHEEGRPGVGVPWVVLWAFERGCVWRLAALQFAANV